MILDTSVLIDILRGDFDREELEKIEEETVLKTTAITEMELWDGVLESDSSEKERKKVKELLGEMESLDFRPEDGKSTGEISHDLRERGKPIDLEDMMIASIALNRNERVLTHNRKHFGKIEELEVRTP